MSDAFYTSGEYFEISRAGEDAEYKVKILRQLIEKNKMLLADIKHVADVGCGSGRTTFLIMQELDILGFPNVKVDGFDIHPRIKEFVGNDQVEFYYGDFFSLTHYYNYDLIVLFDVVEHIPDPIGFIKKIGENTRWVVFHIPLDDSWITWLRNLSKSKIKNPGHLVFLDIPAALNLVALGGLKTADYCFSPSFQAPSGKITRFQRLLFPLRFLLYYLSPFLLQKTFGGVSLMVLACSGAEGNN